MTTSPTIKPILISSLTLRTHHDTEHGKVTIIVNVPISILLAPTPSPDVKHRYSFGGPIEVIVTDEMIKSAVSAKYADGEIISSIPIPPKAYSIPHEVRLSFKLLGWVIDPTKYWIQHFLTHVQMINGNLVEANQVFDIVGYPYAKIIDIAMDYVEPTDEQHL